MRGCYINNVHKFYKLKTWHIGPCLGHIAIFTTKTRGQKFEKMIVGTSGEKLVKSL